MNKISKWMWGLFRFAFIVVNHFYVVPTHYLWLLMLWPLQWISPKIYRTCEEISYQGILSMVSAFSYTAGYNIVEMGDDIRSEIINEKSLLMANHQSTSDVLLIMAALDGYSSRHMWIMDRRFLKTHVGLVSWFHKDFFIRPGKTQRGQSLLDLTTHIKEVYLPFDRTWIILFPEGGFLHKRREISRKFSLQNNLPILHNITIPRVGAIQNIVAAIRKNTKLPDANLKWIVDLTIAYPNGEPLDIVTIFGASRPPCNVIFHYKCYSISEIPRDDEQLKRWVWDRYIEKESMLSTYYSTGKFPDHRHCKPRLVVHDGLRLFLIHLIYITSTLFHWRLFKFLFP